MYQQLDFLNNPQTIAQVNPTPLEVAINRAEVKPARHRHYEAAKRAHYNTSFSPDRRAESFCIGFDKDMAELEALGVPEAQRARYEQLVVRHLGVKSRCISSMITGPANFPVRRAEKANRAEHTASEEASKYYAKIVGQAKSEAYYAAHPEARPVMAAGVVKR